jgi:hypothetical protein
VGKDSLGARIPVPLAGPADVVQWQNISFPS